MAGHRADEAVRPSTTADGAVRPSTTADGAVRPSTISATHLLNGRPRQGARPGWRIRLTLTWDEQTGEHVWLTVTSEPHHRGAPHGAWLLPFDALSGCLRADTRVGSVRLAPDGERLWVEIAHVRGPWTANVPITWVRRFVAEVRAAR